MVRTIEIVDYDSLWPARFRDIASEIRGALGDVALRIDHIGSTAVPGLAAKPIIDVQISVDSFEPVEPFRSPLEALGWVYRADNPDLTKRYFRESPGNPRTHIHVRRIGSFSQQFPLLFRDYLRIDQGAADEYAAMKRTLAAKYPQSGLDYTAAKGPIVWEIIHRADEWAQGIGWEPGPTDA